MTRASEPTDPDRIDAAINRVLEREHEAHAAILDCQERASRRLAEARRVAQRIESRAEERVAAVHTLCDRSVAQAISALLGRRPPAPARPSPDQLRRIDLAIVSLADEILEGWR